MRGIAKLVASVLVLGSLGQLGCERAGTSEPTRVPDPVQTDPAQTDPDPDPPDIAACQTSLRFADYDWVPEDARLTASIQRDDPGLSAALTLLAARSDDADTQLPVFAALDFRNLGLQLGNLDRLLGALELDPAELVELQSPRGEFVWTWSSSCPLPVLSARALDRFGVMLRADFERPGLRHGAGSAERFPFDLLTFGEHRVALTKMGHGQRVGAWLHDATRDDDQGPGQILQVTPLAAIRVVLGGEALLDPSSVDTPLGRRTIRVTASEWTSEHHQPTPLTQP